MNADRWKQIDELFDAVLDLPEAEREAFLSDKTNGDEDLKNEVRSLLDAQKESDTFLQQSAMRIAAKNLALEGPIIANTYFLGKTVGTYKIEKLLGAGGMGEVYLAKDETLGRKVALKILPAEYGLNDESVTRFALEAHAISALNHPNIVTIYHVGVFESINYIVTEYVEGNTLRDLISTNPKLKDVLGIIIQSCEALSAAHAAGIIHRDIKPENIMVRPDGYVKILDFGLSKLLETDSSLPEQLTKTAKGMIIGTPAYMSPEQVADENVDHRTDLWSIGVVLYELLTGLNPFKKENRQATFQSILSDIQLLPSSMNADISSELDQILVKALEKDADFSYQTVSDLLADLKRIKRELDSSTSLKTTSGSLTQRDEQTMPRKDYRTPAFAFLFLTLIGVGTFFWIKYYRNQAKTSPWNNAIATQLTDFAGAETYPSISPDGKVLIYSRLVNGKYNIFYQRIGGSNPQNLTNDASVQDWQPVFSPNGEQIAFRSSRHGGGVFVMGATGEAIKRLTDFGFNPTWSPDGKEIVFSTIRFLEPDHRNSDGDVWTVNVSNGETRQITRGVDALQPQFSPNGKRIAFWGKDKTFQRDLWTVLADGSDTVRVTNDAPLDWNPVWSPDGEYLYFCSVRTGGSSLWRIAIDKERGSPLGEPEPVVGPLAQSSFLTISRDGKNIVFVQVQRNANIQRVEFDRVKMQTVGKSSPITTGTKRARTVDISPDGNQVVFYLTGDAHEDLVTVGTQDLKWNQLTDDEAHDRVPRFSPDGSRIAYYSNLSGIYEIWTIKPDGSGRQQLTNESGRGVLYPVWSPDGSRMAYSGFGSGVKIMEVSKPWANQTLVELPPLNEKGDWFVGWSWSPDGTKLAGWRADQSISEYSEIYVYTFKTNQYEKISDNALRPIWLADNRHLLATQDTKLFIFDTQSKTERELLSFLPQRIDAPAITHDNRYIFYHLIALESDIQMLSIK